MNSSFPKLWLLPLALTLSAAAQDEPMQPPRSSQVPRPPASTAPAPSSVPKPPGATGQQTPGSNSGQSTDQSEPSNDAGVFVFRKQVQEVILHATVVDSERRLVTSLQKGAFTIYEDNRPQLLTAFRREDVPVALGIVVDNSGSMQDKRAKVNQAVLNLVHDSNPDDEVFVVNFGEDYYLDQDFTNNVNLVRAALQQSAPMRGKTALYDAIVASATHLKGSARLEKKVLLVITDGQDNASQETLREAARRLQQQNGPVLYAIGIAGANDRHPGEDPLATLAASTGGVAFFPQTPDEVAGISRTIARDIRSQFILGYKSNNPALGGGYRNIKVDAAVQGMGPLTVRTRRGYIPGQPIP